MVYREKKVWDYDAELITSVFGMKQNPEEMTIGFEHSKLRYMYDGEGRRQKLLEMVSRAGKELLFVEGAENLRYGISLGLDPLSISVWKRKHSHSSLLRGRQPSSRHAD